MKNNSETDNNLLVKSLSRRRVIKGVLGASISVAILPLFSGVALAHFPLKLNIDIQPENSDNFLDPDIHDTIKVAVHRSEFINSDGEIEVFNPIEEPRRYRFGSRNTLENGDGARPNGEGQVTEIESGHGESNEALVLEFPVEETRFDGGEETGWLFWERSESGKHGYSGIDTINVYGMEKSNQDIIQTLRQMIEVLKNSN